MVCIRYFGNKLELSDYGPDDKPIIRAYMLELVDNLLKEGVPARKLIVLLNKLAKELRS